MKKRRNPSFLGISLPPAAKKAAPALAAVGAAYVAERTIGGNLEGLTRMTALGAAAGVVLPNITMTHGALAGGALGLAKAGIQGFSAPAQLHGYGMGSGILSTLVGRAGNAISEVDWSKAASRIQAATPAIQAAAQQLAARRAAAEAQGIDPSVVPVPPEVAEVVEPQGMPWWAWAVGGAAILGVGVFVIRRMRR